MSRRSRVVVVVVYRMRVWLRDGSNRIWLTQIGAAVFAVAAALIALVSDRVFDEMSVRDVSKSMLDDLLTVIASSMLAVATFSLGIVVAAYTSASTGATPRATAIVMRDQGTRRAIGSFIGAFIFAIVAKVALGLGAYDRVGRMVLLVATVLALAYLVWTIVMWVRTLTTLGRLHDTLDRLGHVSRQALEAHVNQPYLGGAAGSASTPDGHEVSCMEIGYLTHIDMQGLQADAQAADALVHVRVRPGAYLDPTTTVAVVEGGSVDQDVVTRIRGRFVVEDTRQFTQDPRYGLMVLAEVAQRALSPAVNDPGTAINVMSLMTKLLLQMCRMRRDRTPEPVLFDRVSMVALDERDLVLDGFPPIARDGAAVVEVQMRMQKLLDAIARGCGALRGPAEEAADRALEHARVGLRVQAERDELLALHRTLRVARR